MDHVVEGAGHLGPLDADGRRRGGEASHGRGDVGVASERRVTAQRFVEEQAQGVDVGAGVGGSSVDLLRREIARGAHHGAGAGQVVAPRRLGDAEVGDLDLTGRWHQHVGGLHVAVDETGAVGGLEGVGHLLADADHLGDREAAALVDEMTQRGPVDQLHHDVGDAVVVAGVVGRDDVGV